MALFVCVLIQAGLYGFAQDKSPVEFGKVTAADFSVAVPGGDTSADAVVISDVGIKSYDRGQGGYAGFTWYGYLQETKRILILKKSGFEAATVTIPLLDIQTQHEEITDLKAATYNLEGGKVVKTELDKNSIFKVHISDNWTALRFTFPAIREGSIIEYTYMHTSPFVLVNRSWPLQSIYPCLWNEYKARVPATLAYSVLSQSSLPFSIETAETKQEAYGQLVGEVKIFHWAVRDVPAMREEPFTTTVNNYLAKVDVKISGFETQALRFMHDPAMKTSGTYVTDVRVGGVLYSWLQLDRMLLQSDHFGADLTSNNSWLDKDLKEITAGAKDDGSKARKIYAYVRDNFACNANSGYLMTHTIKSVYKARTGSEAELNLVLTAMLDHEKLNAVPVVLSTRSNGFIDALMPQGSRLNYVICKLRMGGESIFLDASDRNLGYGQLPLECYNGYDVVVDTTVRFPETALSADSLTERKKIVVFLTNGDKGGLDGSIQSFPGLAEAREIRKKMKEQDGEKKFLEQLRSGSALEETISDLEFDSLQLPDEPLSFSYSCHLATDGAPDIFYFTPSWIERMTVNPFKEAVRAYPVEMPYARDVSYILTMDIPSGYVVDELPKSEKVLLGDDAGYFEYLLSQDGDQIHFRTRVRLTRANFQPQEYGSLRAFFAEIVNKENEQIVFKKKK